jgi:hypothetical protein
MTSSTSFNVNYNNKNLVQPSNTSCLLHLPHDVLRIITRYIPSESSDLKSAIRAVEFSRVCAYTHLLTHENEEIENLLEDEGKFVPLVKFLRGSLQGGGTVIDEYYAMRLHLDTNDADALLAKIASLFEDYLRDHPGPGSNVEALEAFKTELRTFLDQEPNNKKDLFKVFYAIFKRAFKSCVENGDFYVNNPFAHCAGIASNLLGSEPSEQRAFLQKIHRDMIDEYTKMFPLEDLTIDRYNHISKQLLRFFAPSHPPQFHEFQLRQALQRRYDKSIFEALSQEWANPGEKLHVVKDTLRAIRSAELANVKAEIDALCGDYFNGAIDAEYRTMVSAEKAMHAAKAEYFESVEGQIALLVTTQNPNLIEQGHQRVNALFQKLAAAMVEYKSHRERFEGLNARLAELAVWTNDVMTGGRKIELEAGLKEEKLTADAYLECQKISGFYALLAQPIDENNKDEAYELMHNLIG